MTKTASINTRIDPIVKEQAEAVLNELGLSMATAMNLFLKQVVIHKGIPFEISLPKNKPVSCENLSEQEFNTLMQTSFDNYKKGNGINLCDFEKKLAEDIG